MRQRILATIVAITALAVALFAIPLGVVVQHHYLDVATQQLEREAILAAGQISTTTTGSDPADLPSPAAGTTFGLYDATGRHTSGDGPSTADGPVLDALSNRISDTEIGGRLVVAVPVAANEQVVAVVRAERPLSAVTARTHRTWLAMAGLAALIVIAAALVARWQAARLTRPLDAVRDGARRLGDGDFTTHVAASGIAELDDVALALNQTGGRIGDLVQRERAFSADVSHQLRTPLTALRLTMETELATPRADSRAVAAEALAAIERLETTTEELMALARDQAPARAPLDLSSLMSAVDQRWHGLLASQGRRLTVTARPGGQAPTASATAVGHALDVLVDNAVHHGSGTVTVEAHPVQGGVAITVADEGDGVTIDPTTLFERRPTSSHANGNSHGIGLALARSLVETEGGRLILGRAKPAPRFDIVLPTTE